MIDLFDGNGHLFPTKMVSPKVPPDEDTGVDRISPSKVASIEKLATVDKLDSLK